MDLVEVVGIEFAGRHLGFESVSAPDRNEHPKYANSHLLRLLDSNNPHRCDIKPF